MDNLEQQKLREVQQSFAAHIRDPLHAPRPNAVPPARMQIYNDLIYKNVEGFLRNGFPILRQLYSDSDWHELVRDFIRSHRSETPYFAQIGEEFVAFLSNEREAHTCDPAYLLELAYYEWVEAALFIAEDSPLAPCDGSSLEDDAPVVSSLAWSMQFQYPVHKIGPSYRPSAPEMTFLVVYRDNSDKVGFLEINALTARLIALCREQQDEPKYSGRALIERIAVEMAHPQAELAVEGGLKTLAQLASLDIIQGSRKVMA